MGFIRVHRTMVPRATHVLRAMPGLRTHVSPARDDIHDGEVTGPDVIVKLPFIPCNLCRRYGNVPPELGSRVQIVYGGRREQHAGSHVGQGARGSEDRARIEDENFRFERVAVDVTVCTPPTRSSDVCRMNDDHSWIIAVEPWPSPPRASGSPHDLAAYLT